MGAHCFQGYQLLWLNSKHAWGSSFRKYNTFSYKKVVEIISRNTWYLHRSEKMGLKSKREPHNDCGSNMKEAEFNNFPKTPWGVRTRGWREASPWGRWPPLRMCKNKMMAWIPLWLHWQTPIDRFLGAKFRVCGRDLNVSEEICKELCI